MLFVWQQKEGWLGKSGLHIEVAKDTSINRTNQYGNNMKSAAEKERAMTSSAGEEMYRMNGKNVGMKAD